MSTASQAPQHPGDGVQNPSNGNSAIRLPPISFLLAHSGATNPHTGNHMAPIMLPAENGRRSLDLAFFPGPGSGEEWKHQRKVSLPEPQLLNLYPRQNAVPAQNPEPLASPVGFHQGRQANQQNQQNQPSDVGPNLAVNQRSKPENISMEILSEGSRPHQHVQYLSHMENHHHHHYPGPHHHHQHSPNGGQANFQRSANLAQREESAGMPSLGNFNAQEQAGRIPAAVQPSGPVARAIRTRKKIVRSRIYEQINRAFPERRHLGKILYNPTTTWESLQIEQLCGLLDGDREALLRMRENYKNRRLETSHGEKSVYIPVIPPLSSAYCNSFIEVKIPYKHIKEFLVSRAEGVAERQRELWGGHAGIYTDDSNLLYVLCHLGLFDGDLDLTDCNAGWKASDVARPAHVRTDEDGIELLDVSVTLLLLPSLNRYRGFYRHGINSRSWSEQEVHTGLSYAVHGVKWETFLLVIGDRALHKRAAREFDEDRGRSKRLMAQKSGWQLDLDLHRETKKKISKAASSAPKVANAADGEKNSDTTNGAKPAH